VNAIHGGGVGERKKRERARYGLVAWRFFAYMGIIGVLGLILLAVRGATSGFLNTSLLIAGAIITFIGLYIGGSYLYLYPTLFRPRVDFNPMGDIIRKTGMKGDEKILDVGCGTGRVSIQIAKMLDSGRVTGVDIFEGVSGDTPDIPRRNAEIEGVSERVEFRHGNALDLPFDDNTFDIVTMGSVLHEIHSEEDKKTAIKEIVRVLKPGGRFVTLELVRNWKMYLTLLFFAFVWKPVKYWESLFSRPNTRIIEFGITKSVLDMAVFVVEGGPKV
jgi:SAM-dependent methyltransferase